MAKTRGKKKKANVRSLKTRALAMTIAKVCHEVNRAYCAAIGDNSHLPWAKTPANIKNCAISGVEFRLQNPKCSAEDLHANWVKDKTADGFVFGEVKDLEKKTHPCMVPYEQLPLEQRVKDHLFATVVEQMKGILK
jgi:hypothetical protein